MRAATWIWLVVLMLFMVAVVPAAFVALFPPSSAAHTVRLEMSTTSPTGEFLPSSSVRYEVRRGPIRAGASTTTLWIRMSVDDGEDLEGMRVSVTDEGLRDDPAWEAVAEVRVPDPGRADVTLEAQGAIPVTSRAYRIEELRAGRWGYDRMSTLPRAPTLLGRIRDQLAALPALRWVPSLR